VRQLEVSRDSPDADAPLPIPLCLQSESWASLEAFPHDPHHKRALALPLGAGGKLGGIADGPRIAGESALSVDVRSHRAPGHRGVSRYHAMIHGEGE
jgi:hypothetical protein